MEEQNVRETLPGRFGRRGIYGRQVHLGQTTVNQGDIDPDKVVEALERPALAEAASGPLVFGLVAPSNTLVLGKRTPPFGDGAKAAADGNLGGRLRIGRDEIGIGDRAIPVALPNCIPSFA